MKFYPNQLSLIVDGIKNKNIKAVLLYGFDKGLISFLCKKIAALFSSAIDLEIDSAEEFKYELDAYDLFGSVFLKKIYYKKEFDVVIKSINKSDHLHFPVIIADDAKAAKAREKLSKSSFIKKSGDDVTDVTAKKRGGAVKKYASGGMVSSASRRADGIATKGKTRGKIC